MSSVILVSGLAGLLNAMGCQVSTPPAVKLVVQISPVHVAADYGRAEIAGLADRERRSDVDSPVGFFVANLSYKVRVSEVSQPGPACSSSYQVELTALLDRRTIEVANDLPNPSCSFNAAVTHYTRIMSSDEEAVVSISRNLGSVLSARLADTFRGTKDPLTPEGYRNVLVDLARTVVEENASETLEKRMHAQAAARDSDDVQAAIRSCGTTL